MRVGLYSDEIIREIQSRADIVEIVSEYVSLQKRGENYVGLCPFHSEKTPSFNVSPGKQLFYCFGCGIGGNVYTFLMKKENLSFPEAVRWLAERLGIKLPGKLDHEMSEKFRERLCLLQVNRMAAEFFHHNLLNTAEGRRALRYLDERGVTADTIEAFYLGYALPAWDGLIRFARSRGLEVSHLEKAGLVIPRKDNSGYYDRFRDRIIFPIEDSARNIIGFGGRVIDHGEPKYLNSPETPVFSKGKNLYALSKIKKDPELDVIVVEGYMDCISLHQSGFTQTVASLGTALTGEQANTLKRFSKGVVLAYDADSAGQAATLRGMDILAREGLRVKILRLPEGKDPDEFIRLRGRKAFQEQLTKAIDLVSFKLDLARNGLDIKTPDGKLRFLKKSVEILSVLKDELEREVYVQKLAEELNIPAKTIKDEIKKREFPDTGFKYKNRQTRDNNKEFSKILPVKGFYKAERDILKLLIENEIARRKIIKDLVPAHFIGKNTRKIAQVVFEIINRGQNVTVSDLFNYLDDESAAELSKILVEKVEFQNDDMIDSLIRKVKEGYLKVAIRQVREQIKKAETVGEREETINLLNTYQKLKSEMNQLKAYLTPGKGGI
ncbi:DNA primase [Thermoanaerobacterium sp. DL9XJH110]|uniref:DNA primase n=1 Tax=Thermoanaerobacterium sp. DL9XJH110 TaxID=3386643 RepID=UPI003BB76A45